MKELALKKGELFAGILMGVKTENFKMTARVRQAISLTPGAGALASDGTAKPYTLGKAGQKSA